MHIPKTSLVHFPIKHARRMGSWHPGLLAGELLADVIEESARWVRASLRRIHRRASLHAPKVSLKGCLCPSLFVYFLPFLVCLCNCMHACKTKCKYVLPTGLRHRRSRRQRRLGSLMKLQVTSVSGCVHTLLIASERSAALDASLL